MKFSEVTVGQNVKINDKIGKKIADKRISCCTIHNIHMAESNSTGFVDPNAEVELVTE
jgi:hypothetical protein